MRQELNRSSKCSRYAVARRHPGKMYDRDQDHEQAAEPTFGTRRVAQMVYDHCYPTIAIRPLS